ncbi:tRNA (adenine(58)-N(1))-methyltransferase non-catalytic subunit TRM6 [Trichoplax sp. H2]|nr:tRNA (adenine(58)-N(1))-methyltransferase non-catalytic subunit TRM6 [Trichoplax sp. H2]|eukprot:RDD47497.1 tRNA (adenine(58)-N(1))-methyltransferase non-catalytic subunit TRM6 [Trichoplax sp. H2]
MRSKGKIDYGDKVIIEKGDKFKYITIRKGRKACIDRLNFYLDNAVGCYYNTTFDVRNDHLYKLHYEEISSSTSKPAVIEGIDNSTLADDPSSQKLSRSQIEDYKKSGVIGMDLVEKLVKNSATFDAKTEFSKVKYIKKKLKNHLRYDTLAQLLTMADVKAKSKLVIAESCQGLVTAAVMERMGGEGVIIQVHAGDVPTVGYSITNCNFPQACMDMILYLSLRKVNSKESDNMTGLSSKPADSDNEKQDAIEKKLAISTDPANDTDSKQFSLDKNQRIRMELEAKKHLSTHDLDGLIIATKFDPLPILKSLIKYIAPSRPFIIYCFLKEPLAECYVYLQEQQLAVNIQLTETWLREYQVLPDRTHPLTMMSGTGGYLLSGIKIDSDCDKKDVINNENVKDSTIMDNEGKADLNIVHSDTKSKDNYSIESNALRNKRELTETDNVEMEAKKIKTTSKD